MIFDNKPSKAEVIMRDYIQGLKDENESLTKTILEQKDEIDRLSPAINESLKNDSDTDGTDYPSLLMMCRDAEDKATPDFNGRKFARKTNPYKASFADVLDSGRKAFEKSEEVEDIDHKNANSPFKDNPSRNTASRLFQHYMRQVWRKAGLDWDRRAHGSECTEMIDEIINAAVLEVRKEYLNQAKSPLQEES